MTMISRCAPMGAVFLLAACAAPSAHESPEVADRRVEPALESAPVYPVDAARACTEGFVHLAFGLDERGYPTDVEVLESEPPGVFDDAAITAVSRHEFPVPVDPDRRYQQRVRFEIDPSLCE
ncbi:MAG: TonB family protein [Wenzhouxiangellaceae bacterium]|nr:TonB family protein [Wenzhouxiangellaceae bacterium]